MSPANLAEVDTQRIQDFMPMLHTTWSLVMQAAISLAFLFLLLGPKSVLTAVLSLPLIHYYSLQLNGLMDQFMQGKDQRLAVVIEMIEQIKSIQLNNWHSLFASKVDDARSRELSYMRRICTVQAAIMGLSNLVPELMAASAFTARFFLGGDLSSSTIFPVLGYFLIFKSSLLGLSSNLALLLGCLTSFRRIHDFFLTEEQDNVALLVRNDHVSPMVTVRQAFFGYMGFQLEIQHMDLAAPCLVTISGPVGSGKSTLLRSLVGVLPSKSGDILLYGQRAYVPQEAFIIAATFRQNILFGRPFRRAHYERVLKACALDVDISRFPNGDQLDLSGSGIALSGGQKARVCLARALYSAANVYFMDDPLAALDAHVQRHLMEHIFGPGGLLKDSVCVVSTSSQLLVQAADVNYKIDNGLLQQDQHARTTSNDRNNLPKHGENLSRPRQHILSMETSESDSLELELNPEYSEYGETKEAGPLVNVGKVKMGTFMLWLRMARKLGWAVTAVLIILTKVANVASAQALRLLSQQSENHVVRWLSCFTIMGLLQSLCSWLFILAVYLLCLLPASHSIHSRLTDGVLHAPRSFFDKTSVGNVINRFANDVSKVDGSLAGSFLLLFITASNLVMVMIVLILVIPSTFTVVCIVSVLYAIVQSRYLHCARTIKRIEANSRTPVLTSIQQAWKGYDSILAQGQRNFMVDRHFAKVNQNLRAQVPLYFMELWLAVRLEFLGCLLQAFTAGLLLWSRTDSGTLGFVMNYTMQVTAMMQQAVIARSNLEVDIVSVERIQKYIELEKEGSSPSVRADSFAQVPEDWPTEGTIKFTDFSASYKDDGALCLERINFEVASGQRVAILGRTGAGKSSIFLAMARVLEAAGGSITIDGVNIASLDIKDLRSRISFIPQEPPIFTGSLRDNLDPMGAYSDDQLHAAIAKTKLCQIFKTDGDIFKFNIIEKGKALSDGQIQMLAITRALLSKAQVIILDEATASLDHESELVFQQALQDSLHGRTIIAISHRLEQIVNYDNVLILNEGRVAEYGQPQVLLRNTESFLSQLLQT
ncbi:P-loop containing nucleoside triphosphate hydrolase protein [Aspergillus venezuelensis]